MSELQNITLALPPTAPGMIESLKDLQERILEHPQVPIFTEHVLHGGMYCRTITLPPGIVIIGAHVKVPTIVICVGTGRVLIGDQLVIIDGYQVLPASADRKQIFAASEGVPLIITAIFPTSAKKIEDAEWEFTDEADKLLSRDQPFNKIVITGE